MAMKVLIVIAHIDPHKAATAYRISDAAREALTAAGHEVKITDLIHEGFDKVATPDDFKAVHNEEGTFSYLSNQEKDNLIDTIRRQQELILWCDHLLVIGPMWYFRYPACLYSWVERCFTNGFASDGEHEMEEGTLKGRKVSFIITTGAGYDYYSTKSFSGIDGLLYATVFQFRYVGFQATRVLGFWNANTDQNAEKEWIEKFRKAIVNLDNWPLMPTGKEKVAPGEQCDLQIIASLDPITVDSLM